MFHATKANVTKQESSFFKWFKKSFALEFSVKVTCKVLKIQLMKTHYKFCKIRIIHLNDQRSRQTLRISHSGVVDIQTYHFDQ